MTCPSRADARIAMSYTTIDYTVTDRVLTLTLNRPDRLNAFTVTMADELVEMVEGLVVGDDGELPDLVSERERAAVQVRFVGIFDGLTLEERVEDELGVEIDGESGDGHRGGLHWSSPMGHSSRSDRGIKRKYVLSATGASVAETAI